MSDYQNSPANHTHSKKIYNMVTAAVITAVICVAAPISIPMGPVPISLTTLVLYISLYLLGWKLTSAAAAVYIAIGIAGLPVFSGFSGGLGKIMGPTGGYIVGFIPMVIAAGIIIDRYKNRGVHFLGFLLGTAICYTFGTFWFCIQSGTGITEALGLCVIPFIPGDLAKIAAAMIISPIVKKTLIKSKLFNH